MLLIIVSHRAHRGHREIKRNACFGVVLYEDRSLRMRRRRMRQSSTNFYLSTDEHFFSLAHPVCRVYIKFCVFWDFVPDFKPAGRAFESIFKRKTYGWNL